jgi:hypothetical protein
MRTGRTNSCTYCSTNNRDPDAFPNFDISNSITHQSTNRGSHDGVSNIELSNCYADVYSKSVTNSALTHPSPDSTANSNTCTSR